MTSRTWMKLSFASPRITTLGSFSAPTVALRASPKCSGATGRSLIHSPPASSMETRIRPLSSPCAFGFAVFGRLTSGPFLFDPRRLDFIHFDVKLLELRYSEQTVHKLGRCPIHLDMESLNLAREVVEGHDGRNCDEDTQGRRDQGLSDAARNHRHSAGPRGRDAPESVDDSDHCAEKTNERGSGADCGKEPETPLQLNQHFGYGVPECARDELERSDRITSALAHAVVLDDARRDHLRHVGILVLPPGFDQILGISPMKELLELGLELF